MKKQVMIEVLLSICVSYTMLSIVNAFIVIAKPQYSHSPYNSLMMLLWCTIATVVLFSHRFLQGLSPLMMIAIQYMIALSLVTASVYVTGLFEALHPDAYIDAIRNFSIPYGIGAVIYYLAIYVDAKNQNKLLQEIKHLEHL